MRRFTKIKVITLAGVVLVSNFVGTVAYGTESVVLPIKSVTPGEIDERVSQENISQTVCVSGYSKKVRPPVSYTGALKAKQLRSTYSIYKNTNNKDFEEDHLIPLSIGGSPTSEKNLWPQPYADSKGAYLKDKLEFKLYKLVCDGKVPLSEAQKAIAENWYKAYLKYRNY